MLAQSVQDALNQQIRGEFQSAYLYLSMAAYCESENLPGFAQWLRVQHQEEWGHAMKLFDYVSDRGGRVTLGAIEAPPAAYQSVLDVFQQVLDHEEKVTGSIHSLYAVAVKEQDYATQVQLQWFITEQVEEEKSAGLLVSQLETVQGHGTALIVLDRHMGKRGAE